MTPTPNFEDHDYRFIIGIDLGTTNSAVTYVDLTAPDPARRRKIEIFEIPQLVAGGEVAPRAVLPSFLYLPGPYDLPPGSAALPWDAEREYIVGEFAREQGARVPDRLVASAKSWLCHGGVDRRAEILPWGAGGDIPKVSPVTASMRYLQHIREAWDYRMRNGQEERQFDQQLVVLTVPASFDEVARELTVTAAQNAGISRVVLLEEPLAAFYAWLSRNEDTWQEQMQDGQVVLVCDVGGGTTDFSIIGIKAGEKGLRFNRLAVGEHLMLGGDNMDLALARYLERRMTRDKLDTRRWHQLVYQCRRAKETLLGAPEGVTKMGISLIGPTGKLIAGTLKDELTQEEIQELIVEGFFPEVPADARPEVRRKGLTEYGLPYVQDPAITRHAAAFWQRYEDLVRAETGRVAVFPDFLLFNGGALSPTAIRWHLTLIIQRWFAKIAGSSWTPRELANPRPELAVAIGAAYYGLVRLGEGVRVGSGSPRAYYAGIDTPRQKGQARVYPGVCLVPRGTEEGSEIHLDQLNFEARTNQPVMFQLYTSSTRVGDQLGEAVELEEHETTVLPPIRTVLRYGKREEARQIPVTLAVRLTEIGTLELFCESRETQHRWRLQFDVRQDAGGDPAAGDIADIRETVDTERVDQAVQIIGETFSAGSESGNGDPEQLVKRLEATLSLPKEKWATPLVRKLGDALLAHSSGRALSAAHEARWLNLLGYCLRPGFGDPLDEWRMKQIWKLHFEKLKFSNAPQARTEWWIFWRRVAGGLTPGRQQQIFQQIFPTLQTAPDSRAKVRKKKASQRLNPHEEIEIWMALANFERLPGEEKRQLGRMLLARIAPDRPNPRELWALGRFGARQPFYGPLDRVVPAAEAAQWVEKLLQMPFKNPEVLANPLVQLARATGDRSRDIPRDLRERVARRLAELPGGEKLQERLENPRRMGREEQDWVFGETLPAGLVLAAQNGEERSEEGV